MESNTGKVLNLTEKTEVSGYKTVGGKSINGKSFLSCRWFLDSSKVTVGIYSSGRLEAHENTTIIAIRHENVDKSFQCCMRFCDTIKAKTHLTEIIEVNFYVSASNLPMCSADVPPKCGWTCSMQTLLVLCQYVKPGPLLSNLRYQQVSRVWTRHNLQLML